MGKETGEVLEAVSSAINSRHAAAEILQKVAEAGSYGSFPDDVTCEEIGRALFRIAMNSPSKDPLMDILNGYRLAEIERRRSEEQSTNESITDLHKQLRSYNPRWLQPPRQV